MIQQNENDNWQSITLHGGPFDGNHLRLRSGPREVRLQTNQRGGARGEAIYNRDSNDGDLEYRGTTGGE